MMSSSSAQTLDLTRDVCPMSFVKARLALEALPPGSSLEVDVADEKTAASVAEAMRELGHQVIEVTPGLTAVRLVIRRR